MTRENGHQNGKHMDAVFAQDQDVAENMAGLNMLSRKRKKEPKR